MSATSSPVRVVRFELSIKSLLIVLALLGALWLLVHALPVLLVLVAALMLVGALNPAVAWMERRKAPRFAAISIVFGAGAVLVVALAMATVPTLIAQVRGVVEHESEIRGKIADYVEQWPAMGTLATSIRDVRYTELFKLSQGALLTAGTLGISIIVYSFATVFLAFYIMIDHDRLRGALFAVVPRSHHIRLSRILLNLGVIVGGYIRGQLLTCALMGAFILALLLACGVPNALAIAAFGGMMDLLPYIGIFLTMGPAVLAAWGQGPVVAGVVFVLMLVYEELESRVLVPVVYGRALRLPSSVVLFSLILGTTLAGIAGALLALPLAAAVLMLVEELRVELPGEAIQPEDVAQLRADHRVEKEYERRAENLPAEEASAVAVEISEKRKEAEAAAAKAQAAAAEKDKPASE
jgi:predicted PurR-regulated permease PerM